MDSLATKPHWVAECGDQTFPSVAIAAARAYLDRWIMMGDKMSKHNVNLTLL